MTEKGKLEGVSNIVYQFKVKNIFPRTVNDIGASNGHWTKSKKPQALIFNGAIETLADTNIIIIETYNFDLTKDSLKFCKMCYFLELKGFRPVDLMEQMFRPIDEAFWQIDPIFRRANQPEFQTNSCQ